MALLIDCRQIILGLPIITLTTNCWGECLTGTIRNRHGSYQIEIQESSKRHVQGWSPGDTKAIVLQNWDQELRGICIQGAGLHLVFGKITNRVLDPADKKWVLKRFTWSKILLQTLENVFPLWRGLINYSMPASIKKYKAAAVQAEPGTFRLKRRTLKC